MRGTRKEFRVEAMSAERHAGAPAIRKRIQRIVDLGGSAPRIVLRAIADVQAVRETLRTAVQSERDRKRVRELDVGGANDTALS
jgi:hypothetical protein